MSDTIRDELVYFPNLGGGPARICGPDPPTICKISSRKGHANDSSARHDLGLLLGVNHHVGMEEIYRALKPRGVGKVTVFRALKMLEEAKLIDRVTSSDGRLATR